MILSARASHIVSALILSGLAASAAADGAQPRKAAAPAIVKPSTSIIALPLSPVIPASQRLCTERTPAGLGYTMLRPASGARPAGSDVVLVNYVGYLAATGVVFDQGMRSPLPVNGVIPGFSQGLQMLAKSGVVRLCIPAAMGYGARESDPIPANSDLVFQVELVDYKTAAEVEALNKAETGDAAAKTTTQP